MWRHFPVQMPAGMPPCGRPQGVLQTRPQLLADPLQQPGHLHDLHTKLSLHLVLCNCARMHEPIEEEMIRVPRRIGFKMAAHLKSVLITPDRLPDLSIGGGQVL